jgi:hypothetical protein
MSAAMLAQTEQTKALQLEIAEIKKQAADSLVETRLKLQKLMEQRPTDPATLGKMVDEAKERAHRQMHESERRFKEELATMPRGNLDARSELCTGERKRLIINGVSQTYTPGQVTSNVPQAFLDMYEMLKDKRRWADGLDAAFRMRTKEGDFMGAGHYNNLLNEANVEDVSPIVEIG